MERVAFKYGRAVIKGHEHVDYAFSCGRERNLSVPA